jgi:hypothetical protein
MRCSTAYFYAYATFYQRRLDHALRTNTELATRLRSDIAEQPLTDRLPWFASQLLRRLGVYQPLTFFNFVNTLRVPSVPDYMDMVRFGDAVAGLRHRTSLVFNVESVADLTVLACVAHAGVGMAEHCCDECSRDRALPPQHRRNVFRTCLVVTEAALTQAVLEDQCLNCVMQRRTCSLSGQKVCKDPLQKDWDSEWDDSTDSGGT